MTIQRVRELEVRFKPVRLPLPVQREVLSPSQAAEIARAFLADSPIEKAVSLHLNNRRRLIGVHTVSIGTIDSTVVQPADVLRAALISGAGSFILAHNHPPGDPTPTSDDYATSRLCRAGEARPEEARPPGAALSGGEGRGAAFLPGRCHLPTGCSCRRDTNSAPLSGPFR
jgi:DNA repair protein RadC